MVAAVTQLFSQGDVNALVGTKSLLGEGWDAPCVNSLILATYVGSFMLSNQMRGRTIRAERGNPEKTGNIWHLACIFPQKSGRTRHADLSGDYEMLVRRFEAFLGISWEENLIVSGIERLGIPEVDSREKMEDVNRMMLDRAADRQALKMRWLSALQEIRGDMEVEQMEAVSQEEVKPGYVFVNALDMAIMDIVVTFLLAVGRMLALRGQDGGSIWANILSACTIFTAIMAARYGIKAFRFGTPEKRMKQISQAMLSALVEIGEIEDALCCKAEVESIEGKLIGTWLQGGSMRDKMVFAGCMEEIWGIIDNPRYLLMKETKYGKTDEYYSVPEVFGRQKARVVVFEKHMNKVLGKHKVVYTRTPEGRRILLRARTKSFVNKNQRVLLRKKVAKGRYE